MSRSAPLVLFLAACGCGTAGVRERPIGEAISEGVAFLLRSQSPDGSWGEGRQTTTYDIMASVPGSHDAFRVGTTALCVMALREAGEREASGRGLRYLVAYDGLRRANRMELYNVWGHTYALQALSRAHREDGQAEIRAAAECHLQRLARYEAYSGGWNYYDFVYGTRTPSMEGTSFGTAAALAALHEAKQAGLDLPEGLVRRAQARLRESRKSDGSFLYDNGLRYSPVHLANQAKGSLGRTQAGHFAMSVWGEPSVGEREIRLGLDTFFREHRFLELGRKRQHPHESWYYTSGYYYYFGHYYAALLIERLADAGDFRAKLKACVLPLQEEDGSWWDYKMWDYGKPYGTAFAVMTLLRCR